MLVDRFTSAIEQMDSETYIINKPGENEIELLVATPEAKVHRYNKKNVPNPIYVGCSYNRSGKVRAIAEHLHFGRYGQVDHVQHDVSRWVEKSYLEKCGTLAREELSQAR
jgi:hypothetical protein